MTTDEILRNPDFKEPNDMKIATIIMASVMGMEIKPYYIGDEVFLNINSDMFFGEKEDSEPIFDGEVVTPGNLQKFANYLDTPQFSKEALNNKKVGFFRTNGTICLTSNDDKYYENDNNVYRIIALFMSKNYSGLDKSNMIININENLILSGELIKFYKGTKVEGLDDLVNNFLTSNNELLNTILYNSENPNLLYIVNSAVESIKFLWENESSLVTSETPILINDIQSETLDYLSENLDKLKFYGDTNTLSDYAKRSFQELLGYINSNANYSSKNNFNSIDSDNGNTDESKIAGAIGIYDKDGNLVEKSEVHNGDDVQEILNYLYSKLSDQSERGTTDEEIMHDYTNDQVPENESEDYDDDDTNDDHEVNYEEDDETSKDYDDGYNDGNEDGYKEGHSIGFTEGNKEGYIDGYKHGHKDGYKEGLDDKSEKGFDEAYFSGLQRGYNMAKDKYNKGKDNSEDKDNEAEDNGKDEK